MTDTSPSRTFIRHVVFFSAKDPNDVDRIARNLSILATIPTVKNFEVSRNKRVDGLSAEIDVVVYGEFESDVDLAAYKSHPAYQQCIDLVRPLRDIRIAADF